mmetsp:Transcript_3004/g.4100  ORF Transcript_3004/g.4100 Transcript_3004/m.4100 type:complete len:202 (-) Transcript_3004:195-800(-)|eukprot:CAMPEP_0185252964 /NCGR_PEP_ID=MMETSP1359-20130426/1900_1 /TAXON_ID=552665 /ORGANISM="Bigelowiella longifila, Strain CCMP242" /LENGTH=201 /DNA_ID=CAMNT_0027835259 /DNA_START=55 /DNA_END=660 /DNA_ORIENTATION=+
MATAAACPTFRWAQTRRLVSVAVLLVDAADIQHTIEDKRISFKANVRGKRYELDFELKHAIDAKLSRLNTEGRNPRFELTKANSKQFWNLLCADKRRFKNYCKIDFDKWKDEDELYDEEDNDTTEALVEDDRTNIQEREEDFNKDLKIDAMGLPPSFGGMTQDDISNMLKEEKPSKENDLPDSDDEPLLDLDGALAEGKVS